MSLRFCWEDNWSNLIKRYFSLLSQIQHVFNKSALSTFVTSNNNHMKHILSHWLQKISFIPHNNCFLKTICKPCIHQVFVGFHIIKTEELLPKTYPVINTTPFKTSCFPKSIEWTPTCNRLEYFFNFLLVDHLWFISNSFE